MAGLPAVLARLRRALLLALVVGVPTLFLWQVTYDAYGTPKLALLVVGVSFALGMRLAEAALVGDLRRLRLALVPAVAIVAPLVVSWSLSSYRGWSLMGLHSRYQGLLPYVVMAIFGLLLADAFAGGPRPILIALGAAGSVVGAYGCLQAFGFDPIVESFQNEAVSTIGNTNFAGGFLALTLPATLSLWSDTRGRSRILWMASTVVVALGWILTFSEGAWAAGLAGVAVAMGLLAAERGRIYRLAGLVAAGAVALGLVAIVLASVWLESSPFGATIQERAWSWQAAIDMAAESPVTGHGPQAFAIEGPRYRPKEHALMRGNFTPEDAHSVPLSFLANAGAFGLAGFLVAALWFLRRVRAIPGGAMAAGAAGVGIAYLVQSLVSIDELSLRLGFWVAVAGVAATAKGVVDARPPETTGLRPASVLVGGAVLVLSVAGAWWGFRLAVADHRVQEGVEAFGEGDSDRAVQEFERALSIRDDIAYRTAFGRFFGEAALVGRADPGDALPSMARSFRFLEDIPKQDALTIYGFLLHQFAVDDPALDERSLALYERAAAVDPWNPSLAVNRADVLVTLDRPEDALDVLAPFVVYPDLRFPGLWGGWAIALLRSGDLEAATVAADRAFELDPSDCHALIASELVDAETAGRPPNLDPEEEFVVGIECSPAQSALVEG